MKKIFCAALPAFICFASCNGQAVSPPAAAKGDTVTALPDSILIVFQDSKNNYWFGSNGRGAYRYDGKNMIRFSTKDGLCGNRISSIQEDGAGTMFFNTGVGVSKFDGQTFTTLRITDTSNEWKLEPGDLWFTGAQDSGLVYRYDGKTLYRLKLPETRIGVEYIAKHPRSKLPFPYSPYDVYSIYKDSKGNMWFGTGVLGALRYDGKSFDWIAEEDVTELHDGPSNGVRSIIEDKNGNFWFSNNLYRYTIWEDTKSGAMKYRRKKGIGDLEGYMSAVKDNNDELWVVTFSAGVWRYDAREKLTHYPMKDGGRTITLFSIYKDHQGVLWLGTHVDGAYRFNGKTFEKFRP